MFQTQHMNRKLQFFLIAIVALVSTNAYAVDGLLVKTLDYCLHDKWFNTIGTSAPKISMCDTVYKKQYFFISVAFSNYDLDSAKCANVEYSIKITKPDKSLYFSQDKITLSKNKISNKDYVQLGNGFLKICFEDNDDYGDYGIELTIHDLISGNLKSLKSIVSLARLPAYDHSKVNDDNDLNKFMMYYYENPRPADALAHYIYYIKSSTSKKETSFPPVIGFFKEIFQNNQFLWPQILECYNKQDIRTKKYLLYLLFYSKLGSNNFFDSIAADEKEVYAKIKKSNMEGPYGTIKNPYQLDMLWGEFSASGAYRPIQRLIQTLDYAKFEGELEKFEKSQKTNEDKQKAMNNAVFKSLVWSLGSNCKNHVLVRNYCEWALDNEKLSEVQKEQLKNILKKSQTEGNYQFTY